MCFWCCFGSSNKDNQAESFDQFNRIVYDNSQNQEHQDKKVVVENENDKQRVTENHDRDDEVCVENNVLVDSEQREVTKSVVTENNETYTEMKKHDDEDDDSAEIINHIRAGISTLQFLNALYDPDEDYPYNIWDSSESENMYSEDGSMSNHSENENIYNNCEEEEVATDPDLIKIHTKGWFTLQIINDLENFVDRIQEEIGVL